MADSERPPAARAVFLSYTTEDLAIALAVCEALRDTGIVVWMDRSELQGGDAWDENIQRQIRECALFVPIISARTQARREGYFRLEWRLADERMRLVAEGTPLIVPVVADDTRQADALVPKSFLTVQWSRLPHGHVPPALVLRVRKLLGLEASGASVTLPPMAMPASPLAAMPLELNEPAIGQLNEKTERSSAPSWRVPLPAALLFALVASLVVGLAVWKLRPAPALASYVEPKPIVRFTETLPPGVSFRNTGRPVVAISPDGRSFIYNTSAGLFLRKLGELNAHVIPGTDQALQNPVFSPDGQSVAFQASSELRKISVNGGASVRIGPAGNSYGISWESDGTILYGRNDGIWRVPDSGSGQTERIIPADAGEVLSAPQLLPGGKSVLFSCNRAGDFQVEVRSLSGGERKVVVRGGHSACYLPTTGHLLYVVETDLFGVAFDVEHLVTIGNPVLLVPEIRPASVSYMGNYAISRDGTLLYLTGGLPRRIPVWVDRQGKEEPLKLEPADYSSPRLSPDGTKLLLSESSVGKIGFFVWDLAGETRTRLTLSDAGRSITLWTPDGSRIIYGSFDSQLMVKPANNTRPPEVFVNATEGQQPRTSAPLFFTPDGRKIFYSGSGGIGSIPIGSSEKPAWLPIISGSAALSPDGKWMAYQFGELGRNEIYVSPFPNVTDDRVVVSKEDGGAPLWSRDGKELYYIEGRVLPTPLMAAAVQSDGGKFTVVARKPVWNTSAQTQYFTSPGDRVNRNYDLSPDNQRFLVLKDVKPAGAADAPEQIFLVQNWAEELTRRVPSPKK